MKRLGKLVIMTDKEHASLMCRCEDADAAAGDLAEELSRAYAKVALVEAARDNAIAVARRFHAAGGYSHTLPKLKEELRQAQGQVSRYRPIGEIFQPSEALTTLLQDVNGVSDCDAAADFEIVGNQVRRERATP